MWSVTPLMFSRAVSVDGLRSYWICRRSRNDSTTCGVSSLDALSEMAPLCSAGGSP